LDPVNKALVRIKDLLTLNLVVYIKSLRKMKILSCIHLQYFLIIFTSKKRQYVDLLSYTCLFSVISLPLQTLPTQQWWTSSETSASLSGQVMACVCQLQRT